MREQELFDLTVQGDIVRPGGVLLKDGWLGVRRGKIAAVSAVALVGRAHVDASGRLVLPGFVDAHVHTRSDPEEGITAATIAAAAGGTTTVVDMPFDRPARPVRHVDALERKILDISAEAVVDVALYATFAPTGPLDAIASLAAAGACGFKVSTFHVDADRFPRVPDGQLYEGFQEIARHGLPVAAHQENQEIIDQLTARLLPAAEADALSHARSRPPAAEAEAAGRLLELAYWTGVRLHMVHGTIPRTFDLIGWHKSQGVAATGETCVQYLVLTEDALRTLGGRAKCNPPLRTQQDVDALWERLTSGDIDIVTSDHSPYPLARKETASIFQAYAGLPGAETLGTLLFSEGVATGRITLGRFLEVLAEKPAGIFGLQDKGRLEVGRDADFVVFDPDHSHVLDERMLHQRCGWSPYHGRLVRGRVEATYLRGDCIFRDERILASPGTGRFLRPAAPRAEFSPIKEP